MELVERYFTREVFMEKLDVEFTPEEQAFIDNAKKNMIPWWRKPQSPQEWDRLVAQKASFAISASVTHAEAKQSNAPHFLTQLTARSKYRAYRRFARTRNRAAFEKQLMCEKLMNALGVLIESVDKSVNQSR